ncbi:tyrosine phosphatase [Cladophialophora carrionii]|uniref:protein-tyrosine-phosphatase n=1 Tax=Cladophialophora carrionii TaxID=86049 RepID=A0A1C1CY14_9EURO|nr:tyrosine phosphatase [Cladophialophora carrionii]
MSGPCGGPSTTTAPLIPDKIFPNLYLSDIHTAAAVLSPNYCAPGLDRPKIKYVLSIIDNPDRQPKVPPGRESEFVLKLVKIRDLPNCDLLSILKEACTFIGTSLKNNDGGVLVHCQKGISRSAAVVIAFVMEEMNLNYDTAFRYVRSSRSKARPNAGFQQQLILWSTLCYNIHDEDGNEKPEYVAWKTENEEQIKKLGPRWTG